jgi:hypothetical protein
VQKFDLDIVFADPKSAKFNFFEKFEAIKKKILSGEIR